MSKDSNLEGDSPDSSIHSDNNDTVEFNNDVFLKHQTRAIIMTLKSLSHKSEIIHSFPSFLHPSSNESVKEVSKIKTQRATDLVHQPSRRGAEPLRVVGPDKRRSKATLNPTSSTSLSVHPISSSGAASDGLNILSEACAVISAPRLHVTKNSTESLVTCN